MPTLHDSFSHQPNELAFGTSGLRGLVTDMTDLECYINAVGFLQFLESQNQLQKGGPVLLGGDLRDSTPRILTALHQAVIDGGFITQYHGLIPTPALAYEGLEQQAPCIMVTGSHIPADRNGIKFYKADGEVLKDDEAPIKRFVEAERNKLYDQDVATSAFDPAGMLHNRPALPAEDTRAAENFAKRFADTFSADCLASKKIVFYQHSAVGRDMLVSFLEKLGAEVIPVGRSETFIPIDSENVTPEHLAYFKKLAGEHPDAFAIVSTDGDSDRPFVVDETGTFHRGDVLGAVVATWFKADAAAYPISSSDAADTYLKAHDIAYTHTKIGSPFVIKAMKDADDSGKERVVGWEVNGGFLTGARFTVGNGTLKALPTRDAFLPILVALLAATERNLKVSALFKELPNRYTDAGLIDNFPIETYRRFIDRYGKNEPSAYAELEAFFTPEKGFSKITEVNSLDGVRIYFNNGDIAHFRESSNAPQLRMYSIAGTAERAQEIVCLAIAQPNGIFRQMEAQNRDT